jgi:hypothetical protein
MAILLAQAGPKGVEDRVFGQIQELRPQAWPNSLMIGLADELLGRKGRLSAALGRLQIRNQPGTEQVMQSCGRGPEIEMARAAAGGPEKLPLKLAVGYRQQALLTIHPPAE